MPSRLVIANPAEMGNHGRRRATWIQMMMENGIELAEQTLQL
jgi:hypothetical protein